MVERHLRRANPTLEGLALRRAVQEAFDSYARYWIESFRLPNLHEQVVEAGIKVSGYEYVTQGLDKGNGVILALPHLGGWEWAGRWLTLQGVKTTVVVERLDPPELFDWFVNLRSQLGMTVVALGPDAGKAVLGALKRNEVVCLLSDRDLDGRGVDVEFFGERTTLPAGPATLGIRTGAPILPTAVYFTPRYNGHFGLVRPPLDTTRSGALRDDVARVTQRLAHELELLITRAPQQWHLFQPNWPSDPRLSQGIGLGAGRWIGTDGPRLDQAKAVASVGWATTSSLPDAMRPECIWPDCILAGVGAKPRFVLVTDPVHLGDESFGLVDRGRHLQVGGKRPHRGPVLDRRLEGAESVADVLFGCAHDPVAHASLSKFDLFQSAPVTRILSAIFVADGGVP